MVYCTVPYCVVLYCTCLVCSCCTVDRAWCGGRMVYVGARMIEHGVVDGQFV